MGIRNHDECLWALMCVTYTSEDPCEKPSYKFLRKPKCYIPKKEGLISKVAGNLMEKIMHLGESSVDGTLEE